MTSLDIVDLRLFNQLITKSTCKKPHEVVAWLGAMQAQEYAMTKWSIGLRLPGSIDADIDKAFDDGAILRTHLLRPTWHFVTPADIRWILALSAPRVHLANAFMYRQCELDKAIFKRSQDVIAKALQGGKHLTRTALQSALKKAKITADGFRLSYLMMHAELDGIICSGPRQGKQFTYGLLEERVLVGSKPFDREESLAGLTHRYFTSRGPATPQDFATWSGLTIKEVKEAIAMLKPHLVHEMIHGQPYFLTSKSPGLVNQSFRVGGLARRSPDSYRGGDGTFLMPDYDEYGMGYKDRSALLNSKIGTEQVSGDHPVYNRMIIIDGKIEGAWKRTVKNSTVMVETVPFASWSKAKHHAVMKAVKRYSSFLGKDLIATI